MKKRPYSPDEFMSGLYEKVYRSPYEGISGKDASLAVSDKLRNRLKEILAIDKIPGKITDLKPVTVNTADRGCYTLETLSVEICSGWNMLCYLLTPKKPSGASVIAVCGHGYGARQIIRQDKRGKYRVINFLHNYQKNFAIELAMQGNTVLAFEPIGFGEARLNKDAPIPFYSNSCRNISLHSLIYGFTAASLRIYQAIRCADILNSKGFSELGCMGISGGGLITLYFACLDSRVTRAVVSGYTNTFRDSILAMWHCYDNYIPGILEAGEIYDFASAIVPRKLLIETGSRDPIFPRAGIETAVKHIERIYNEAGCPENFVVDRFDGKHEISGRLSYRFFTKK